MQLCDSNNLAFPPSVLYAQQFHRSCSDYSQPMGTIAHCPYPDGFVQHDNDLKILLKPATDFALQRKVALIDIRFLLKAPISPNMNLRHLLPIEQKGSG